MNTYTIQQREEMNVSRIALVSVFFLAYERTDLQNCFSSTTQLEDYMVLTLPTTLIHSFFYENHFYKNFEAEICPTENLSKCMG